ncbi:MAG: HupE / UreJ protein [Flavobacteriaceae bacterium]|nr:MAG: HupE / UreJ protein [Flavobacteriaceae bacterium]
MQEFWFYIKLGINHVLDFGAYDHILFLAALAIPFTFKNWKKVVLLATVFTVFHCMSLALSVYEIVAMNASWIEFLIPVTILLTALFNVLNIRKNVHHNTIVLQLLVTSFFGLIHGFGFSNYFKMLMAGEEYKVNPLLGFASGIEISQVLIIGCVLVFAYQTQSIFKVKQPLFILICSVLIILITIPMLIKTFPI